MLASEGHKILPFLAGGSELGAEGNKNQDGNQSYHPLFT